MRRWTYSPDRLAWDRLAAALRWQYGPYRTAAILDGRDETTNADIAAWRALGTMNER